MTSKGRHISIKSLTCESQAFGSASSLQLCCQDALATSHNQDYLVPRVIEGQNERAQGSGTVDPEYWMQVMIIQWPKLPGMPSIALMSGPERRCGANVQRGAEASSRPREVDHSIPKSLIDGSGPAPIRQELSLCMTFYMDHLDHQGQGLVLNGRLHHGGWEDGGVYLFPRSEPRTKTPWTQPAPPKHGYCMESFSHTHHSWESLSLTFQ
ncbi:hypothetical protein B0T13DRAFT_447329 [Neurospora crassa]|nr:hypothetical protein B0T13DRAFT_447329 [Neurospora crassa]